MQQPVNEKGVSVFKFNDVFPPAGLFLMSRTEGKVMTLARMDAENWFGSGRFAIIDSGFEGFKWPPTQCTGRCVLSQPTAGQCKILRRVVNAAADGGRDYFECNTRKDFKLATKLQRKAFHNEDLSQMSPRRIVAQFWKKCGHDSPF